MRISFDVSEFVQVVNGEDQKGNPLRYLRLFGTPTLYLVGNHYAGMTNEDWEEIFSQRLSRFFGTVLATDEWLTESPTGRPVRDGAHYVDYVREDL